MITNHIATYHAGGTDSSGFAQFDTEGECYAFLAEARKEGRLDFEFDSAAVLTLEDGRATGMDLVSADELDEYEESASRFDDSEEDAEHDEHDAPTLPHEEDAEVDG
jgi:hypothetical protein